MTCVYLTTMPNRKPLIINNSNLKVSNILELILFAVYFHIKPTQNVEYYRYKTEG